MPRTSLTPAAVALLLSAGCAGAAGETDAVDTEAAPVVPATADWMAEVFAGRGDVALGAMLLPGAFNSSSYACNGDNGISPHTPGAVLTLWEILDPDPNAEGLSRQRIVDWAKMQDRDIGQQLSDGIRALEINLTLKDGELVTWHSVYGAPIGVLLDQLVGFAVAHPREAIVLNFGLDFDSASWPLFADALTAPRADGASLCDLLYDGTESGALATLGDVQASGRNVVWGATGELRAFFDARGDCPMSNFAFDRRWSLTTRPAGVEQRLAETLPGRDLATFLQNDFVFSLDGSADVVEQAGYLWDYASLQEASEAFGFLGDLPGRLIDTYDGEHQMNLFAGAYYQETNLVEAVIARNRARLAE